MMTRNYRGKMRQEVTFAAFLLFGIFQICTSAPDEQTTGSGSIGSHDQSSKVSPREIFSEELLLRPLPDGRVLAHFHFTNRLLPHEHHHMQSFPKGVDQLVRQARIRELELSFTQGRWDHRRWGSADNLVAANGKAPGVELWAWFGTPPHQVDAAWQNLTHTLSGLFCASLNFLESAAASAAPSLFFRPDLAGLGDREELQPPPSPEGLSDSHGGPVRYGALAREAVCTENLTPWLKLLPCRDRAGLATLLDRPIVYGGAYHSMRIHIQAAQGAEDTQPRAITLRQTLTLVMEPQGKLQRGGRPGGGSRELGKQPDWSISSLFGRGLVQACPVARQGRVYVELPGELLAWAGARAPLGRSKTAGGQGKAEPKAGSAGAPEVGDGGGKEVGDTSLPQEQARVWDNAVFSVTPAPHAVLEMESSPDSDSGLGSMMCGEAAGAALALFDIRRATRAGQSGGGPGTPQQLDVQLTWREAMTWSPQAAPYRVQRFITGHGNEKGGIAISLKANRRPGKGGSGGTCGTPEEGEESLQGQEGVKVGAQAAGMEEEEGNYFDFSDYEEQGWRTFPEAGNPSEGPARGEGVGKGTSKEDPTEKRGSADELARGEGGEVLVFQLVPWFIRLYLHTMELWLDGRQVAVADWLAKAWIVPAEDRKSPALFELGLRLPANVSSALLRVEFDKGYLYVDEHPSDASRGMDLPPALFVFPQERPQPSWTRLGGQPDSPLLEQLQAWASPRVYTEALVVPLPLPDFSMPYNVITLSCTVIAMFCGSLINVLRRRPGAEGGSTLVQGGPLQPVGRTFLAHQAARVPKAVRVLGLVGLGGAVMKYLGMF